MAVVKTAVLLWLTHRRHGPSLQYHPTGRARSVWIHPGHLSDGRSWWGFLARIQGVLFRIWAHEGFEGGIFKNLVQDFPIFLGPRCSAGHSSDLGPGHASSIFPWKEHEPQPPMPGQTLVRNEGMRDSRKSKVGSFSQGDRAAQQYF